MNHYQGYQIIRVSNLKQLSKAFGEGLIELFQEIFAAPPYEEYFTNEEVEKPFTTYALTGILYLAYRDDELVGFCAALPFIESSIYEAEIEGNTGDLHILSKEYLQTHFHLAPKSTWYMAELGVRKNFRRRGLGRCLIQTSIDTLEPNVQNILLDTSEESIDIQSLYSSFGFQLVPGKVRHVSQRRQDGKVRKDKRVFMLKVITTSSTID